jgi:hypothetical protein
MKKLIATMLLLVQTSMICFADTSIGEDKKVNARTDDASKLPPKFNDKSENNIKRSHPEESKEIPTAKADKVVDKTPENARNAVMALKKLQTRCKSGISPKEYIPALGEAKSEVAAFVKDNETKDYKRLKELIEKAMDNYQKAGDSMRESLNSVQSLRNRVFQAALQGTGLDSAPLLLSADGQVPVDVEKSNNDAVARYIRTASYIQESIDRIMSNKNKEIIKR